MSVIKFPSRKLNKKKMIIFISICSIAFIFLILSIIYAFNFSFRSFIDIYIFRKEIKSNNLAAIEITPDEDQYFHAYDKRKTDIALHMRTSSFNYRNCSYKKEAALCLAGAKQ